MTNTKEEKTNEFQPVELAEAIAQLLSEAYNTLSPAKVWTKNQELSYNSEVSFFNLPEKKLSISTPKNFNPTVFDAKLREHKTLDCFFCVTHPTANLFFSAAFKSSDRTGLHFEAPAKMHKVQRRANVRFRLPNTQTMWVEFQDPLAPESTVIKQVIDISAGGLAFISPKTDAPVFIEGLALRNFQFTVKDTKILVEAEVRFAKPLPTTPEEIGRSVGVAFKNLNEHDTHLISSWVHDQVSEQYMFLLENIGV